jgi:hypothetical protein
LVDVQGSIVKKAFRISQGIRKNDEEVSSIYANTVSVYVDIEKYTKRSSLSPEISNTSFKVFCE